MKYRAALVAFACTLFALPTMAGVLHVFTSDATGFNTHSVWYDDGKEVTVVDAQFTPAIAQALLEDIRKKTSSPITRIVVTHPSPDKFNGLAVFHKAGVESIASAKTARDIPGVDAYKRYFWTKVAKAFTDESYPKVEPVKTTFSGKTQIRLKSGETLSLFELKQPGVATSQTAVRVDKTGDLIVGDLVHSKTHAWLEGGVTGDKVTPTIEGWKAGLRELTQIAHPAGSGKVYGGRGQFLPVAQAVAEQIAYLDKADAIVTTYVSALGAKAGAELADPVKSKAHHAAIQALLAKAYPDYAMPDLIGYSVYGLANSKVAVGN